MRRRPALRGITALFTSNLFGPGVTITDARRRMTSFDGTFKYRGYSMEGEYYLRCLDGFRGSYSMGCGSRGGGGVRGGSES